MNIINQNKPGEVNTSIYIDEGLKQIGYVKIFLLSEHKELAKKLESIIKREVKKYETAR